LNYFVLGGCRTGGFVAGGFCRTVQRNNTLQQFTRELNGLACRHRRWKCTRLRMHSDKPPLRPPQTIDSC